MGHLGRRRTTYKLEAVTGLTDSRRRVKEPSRTAATHAQERDRMGQRGAPHREKERELSAHGALPNASQTSPSPSPSLFHIFLARNRPRTPRLVFVNKKCKENTLGALIEAGFERSLSLSLSEHVCALAKLADKIFHRLILTNVLETISATLCRGKSMEHKKI